MLLSTALRLINKTWLVKIKQVNEADLFCCW